MAQTSRDCPASGTISFSTLRTVFGLSGAVKFSQLYRGGGVVQSSSRNAGVPTGGTIKLSEMYNSGVIFAPTAQGNAATTLSANGSVYSLDVSTVFTGEEMTYSLSANPQASASLGGSSLSVTGAQRGLTYTVTVTATNPGGSASWSVSVTEPFPPPTVNSGYNGGSTTLGPSTAATYYNLNLLSGGVFFGQNMTYTYSTTGMPSADTTSLSGSSLLIINTYLQNTSWTLTVTATNSSGSASQTFTVVEGGATWYVVNEVVSLYYANYANYDGRLALYGVGTSASSASGYKANAKTDALAAYAQRRADGLFLTYSSSTTTVTTPGYTGSAGAVSAYVLPVTSNTYVTYGDGSVGHYTYGAAGTYNNVNWAAIP